MVDAYENVEDLIEAHRLRLDRVALKLGRGVPEIGKELWEYLEGLSRNLSLEQHAEAWRLHSRNLRQRLGRVGDGKPAAEPAT